MAPGVGKTYRMLQEGHAEVAAGRDVVIGYLEPHDRPETAAQAEGLEMVPRRIVDYGSARLPEMDLGGDPRARAGTGPGRRARPHQRQGMEHAKRYDGRRGAPRPRGST